jgi:Fe-Mn family superoxide dismutase
LNKAVAGTPFAGVELVALQAMLDQAPAAVRNNGGGHYNHSLFWQLLTPQSTGKPTGALAAAIDKAFTNQEGFKAAFEKEAKGVFGSGWAWLCKAKDGSVFVTATPNQDNPLMPLAGIKQGTPILALDVWEHAYYLKNQNRRADYITAFWNVVNWAECEKRFGAK